MEMLLMGAALSVFGLAVACLAFGAATREEPTVEEGAVKAATADARFFAGKPALPAIARNRVPLEAKKRGRPPGSKNLPVAAFNRIPIEALLLQIENHVRLEQAAAECFLESPNPTLLHSRTISQLVN
jgi:hypothetical protein